MTNRHKFQICTPQKKDTGSINDFLAYISTPSPLQRIPCSLIGIQPYSHHLLILINISKEILLTRKCLSFSLLFSGCQTWDNLTLTFTNLIIPLKIRSRVVMSLMPMEIFTNLESKYWILRKYVLILRSHNILMGCFRDGGFLGGSKTSPHHILVKCPRKNVRKGQRNKFSSPLMPLISSGPLIGE